MTLKVTGTTIYVKFIEKFFLKKVKKKKKKIKFQAIKFPMKSAPSFDFLN